MENKQLQTATTGTALTVQVANQLSQKLSISIAALGTNDGEARTQAKMALIARTSELMPSGKPKFEDIRRYPSIVALKDQIGAEKMHMVLLLLVQDFCRSINVVRNMNEDQMIECSAMLLDEAGNFRLEDYVMMFTLAKRGQIGNIFDHVDIQVVGDIIDEYWKLRDEAGKRLQEQTVDYFDNEMNRKDLTFSPVVSDFLKEWADNQKRAMDDESAKDTSAEGREAAVKYGMVHGYVCKSCEKLKQDCECVSGPVLE